MSRLSRDLFLVPSLLVPLLAADVAAEPAGMMLGYDLPGSVYREVASHLDFRRPRGGEEPAYWRDYRDRAAIDLADECRQHCARDPRCVAWTLIPGEEENRGAGGPWPNQYRQFRLFGSCYLKDRVPAAIARAEAISGIKPQPPMSYGRPERSEAAPSTPPTSLRLPEGSTTIQENTDLPGHDYRAEELDDAQPVSCARVCLRDPQCSAWTAVKPTAQRPRMRCWLKDAVPRPVRDQCCTSGVTRRRVSDTDSRAAPSKSTRPGLPRRSP